MIKMGKTKKEHYIPRAAYLRRFSDTHFQDDKKNKLVAYDTSEQRVFQTNVYDSATVNSIYENPVFDENAIEDLFSVLEKDLTSFFDMIERVCMNPDNKACLVLNNSDERDNLKFFIVWQFFRTEKRRVQSQQSSGSVNEGNLEFLGRLAGIEQDGKSVLVKWKETLNRHYAVFERNLATIPFVLPDDPVLVFHSELDPKATVNFRFPLSPNIQVLLIDPNSSENAEMRQYRNRIRFIEDDNYIAQWNKQSVEEAHRHVYITPGKENLIIQRIRVLKRR